MIAIDTNVLLRYLLQDDADQANLAIKLLSGPDKVLVTDVVLVETVWTLKGKRYNLGKEQIVEVIYALFAEPNITFEDSQATWGALKDYINAKPVKASGKTKQADFPDALIANKAKRYGQLNNSAISAVYTFDKATLEIEGAIHP